MTAVSQALDAPMTRGQKFQWYLERGIADGLHRLPDRCEQGLVADLVTALQRRYEVLRTSIELVDGEFRQRVHPAGAPVALVDVPPGQDVAACESSLAEEFVAATAGRAGRILVRFYLVRQGDARWLAIVADSTALDRACYEMLDAAIDGMLGGAREPALAGLQPRELARHEDGPDGRRERHEARRYLRDHYRTAPATTPPRGPARAGDYYRCGLTLDRADELLARVIESTGRLPSATILGLFGRLMSWRVGDPGCALNVSMENRQTRRLRTALCGTAQRAPVSLWARGATLGDAVAAAEGALSEGYPVAGRYDPLDLIEERSAAEARRGVRLTPALAYNFNPPPQGWTALLAASPGDPDLGGATGTAAVVLRPTNETSYEYGASLSVRWRRPDTVRLSVHGDARMLGTGDCAAVLRGVELGLRECARGHQDTTVAGIASVAGLTRGQGQ
jgi:hypothetical protein